ncbi:MAG: cell division protein SepF [Thermostichales cyanobacterium HHBFW_bins_127]
MSLLDSVKGFFWGEPVEEVEEAPMAPDPGDYSHLYGAQKSAAAESASSAVEAEEAAGRRRSRLGDQERQERRGKPIGGNVIGLPTATQPMSEIAVLEPRSFDEMLQVVRYLRERKSVILNLSLMDAAEAQRSVDFVAGATVISDGDQQRIGEGIFLFTPSCVTVTTGMTATTPEVNPVTPFPMPTWSSYPESRVVGGR